jgi:hypothetical protein
MDLFYEGRVLVLARPSRCNHNLRSQLLERLREYLAEGVVDELSEDNLIQGRAYFGPLPQLWRNEARTEQQIQQGSQNARGSDVPVEVFATRFAGAVVNELLAPPFAV